MLSTEEARKKLMAEALVHQADIEGNSPSHAIVSRVPPDVKSAHSGGGIFNKYSDAQKGIILWKLTLAMTIFGFVLATTGVWIDRFDNQEEVTLILNGHEVVVPSLVLKTTSIELGTDGCDSWKVDPNDSPLHSRSGMSFSELREGGGKDLAAQYFLKDSARLISTVHGGDFDEFYIRGLSARVLSIAAVVLQGIAIVWTIIFRVSPSGFFYNRPLFGQSARDHLMGCVFHLLLTVSAVFLLVSVALVCSFRVPLLSRVANFALDWCANSPFDGLARGQNELEYMKFLGQFVQTEADSGGISFYSFSISIFIVYAQVMLVFFIGLRQVKRESSERNFSLPNSQLAALPWYAKILPMKVSVSLLLVAIVANCAAAYSARVRGYDLNIYYYNLTFLQNSESQSWSLSDMFLDRIHKYVMDETINKIMLAAWIPFMFLVGLGSVDLWRYLSKAVHLTAILVMGSAICGVVTVPPTPASVLQKPQCFDPPAIPPSFAQFFSASESCNDVMYSLFSVLITLPVMFVYFYVRYGPIRRKNTAYFCLAVSTLGSLFCLVATRKHYSVDVYVGVVVTILLALSQSAAFKLLFRFGIVHPGLRHKAPIVLSEKLIPTLDDLIQRFELFFMAADGQISDDDMRLIKAEFDTLAESIEFARSRALDDLNRTKEPSDDEDEDDSISTDNNLDNVSETKKDL